jgi:hypothetical protein
MVRIQQEEIESSNEIPFCYLIVHSMSHVIYCGLLRLESHDATVDVRLCTRDSSHMTRLYGIIVVI